MPFPPNHPGASFGMPMGQPLGQKPSRRARGKGGTSPKAHHSRLGQALAAGDHAAAKSHAFALIRSLPQPDNDPDDPGDGTDPTPGVPAMGKDWIAGAIKKPGALHTQLGVPKGQTIPTAKLNAAANSSDPKEAARARLAKTLKGLKK